MDWSEFLGGSATGALITQIGNVIQEWRKNRVNMVQNAQDMAEIHNTLFPMLLEKTHCNRVMIFRATNTAGVIAPGKILKISVVYEDTRDMSRIIDDIQEWRADAAYYQIFSELVTNGVVRKHTEDLQVDSKLRTIYTAQGLLYNEIYHLTTTPKNDKVFFCSIGSSRVNEFTQGDRYYIDIVVNRLQNIFEKHKRVL